MSEARVSAVSGRRLPAWLQAFFIVLTGIAGLLFYVVNVEQTSPVASVELKLSRKDVTERAATLAANCHFDTKNCLRSTIFSCDESAKTFLEYRCGLKQANELMRSEVPVWYWSTRFCRPQAHEEFTTQLAPDGKLVEFNHVVQNERPIQSISHEEAKALAIRCVEQVAGFSLKEFQLFEDEAVPRAHRTDHSFVWLDSKRIDDEAGIFITVELAGNEVVKFSRSLGMPESWDTEYRGLRSYNDALQAIANVAHWCLFVCAFAVVLVGASGREINLRFALTLAIAVASLDVLNTFNGLPDELAAYDKSEPIHDFWVAFAGKALSGGFWELLETFLITGAGELLYRKAYPEKLALSNIFKPQALRSSAVQKQLLLGYMFAGVWLGWNTVYYLAGKAFKFFSPLDWPLESVLSSTNELVNAINVGISAAIGEEFMYRVVALLLLQKVVKNFWVANFIQAAAWAFGHSNYPQEPPYVRGLELLIPGLVCGWSVRTFGLMPGLVAHYLYDAFLGVFPLLQSPLTMIRCPAMAPLLPFSVLPVFARLWRSGEEKDLSNAAIQTQVPPAEETRGTSIDAEILSRPLTGGQRGGLFAVCLISLFVCLSTRFSIVAQTAAVEVSRSRAEDIARAYLKDHKIEASEPLTSTGMANLLATTELQYVMETASLNDAMKYAISPQMPLAWAVRFFKPGESTEQMLYVRSEREKPVPVLTFNNGCEDSCLSEKEARANAEQYLKLEMPQFTPCRFKACSTRRYGQRTDHDVTFTVPRLRVAEADYTVKVEVCGSKIAKVQTSLDMPDDWQLQKSKNAGNAQLSSLCKGLVGVIFGAAFVAWIVGVYRAAGLHWRGGVAVTAVVCAISLAGEYNKLPLLLWQYGTDQSLVPYVFSSIFEAGSLTVFYIAGVFLLGSSALAASRLLLPRRQAASWLLQPFTEKDAGKKADLWIDGVLSGCGCIMLLNAVFALLDMVLLPLSDTVQTSSLDSFCDMCNTFSPVACGLFEMLRGGVLIVFAAPVLAGIYMRFGHTPLRFWLITITGCAIYCAGASSLYQFLFSFSCCFAMMMIGWAFARRFIRLNVIGYFLAGGYGHILNEIRSLLLHGASIYRTDIIILSALLALPLVYALALVVRNRYLPADPRFGGGVP